MPESSPPYEPVEWDEEVLVTVTMRVRVKSNPDYFEGLLGRTPQGMAQTALVCGRDRPDNLDGYADFTGDIDILWVEEGP